MLNVMYNKKSKLQQDVYHLTQFILSLKTSKNISYLTDAYKCNN